jgi:2-oxoglutarate ferredoxin oxidoreductase subunit alpha
VLVMTDGEVGHMREAVVLPEADELVTRDRQRPETGPEAHVPFRAVRGAVPDMADFGTGYHTYVTGLTHDERGLPATDDADAHTELVERLCRKISDATEELTSVEHDVEEGATVGLVSYGVSSRSAQGALRLLRQNGQRVSHLRLITVFPFPERVVQEFADGLDRIIVPEMNLGQMCHVVREAIDGRAVVERVGRIGGELVHPDRIVAAVEGHGEKV